MSCKDTIHDYILQEIIDWGSVSKIMIQRHFNCGYQEVENAMNNFNYDFAIYDDKRYLYSHNHGNIERYFRGKDKECKK